MGYEQLKNIIDLNREEEKRTKEEAMNPTVCPECSYSRLKINSRGLESCEICGWIGR